MKRLWIRRTGGGLLLLLSITIATLVGLMGTTSGLGFLLAVSNRLTVPTLTIGSASGTLFSSIQLQNITYQDGVDTVHIDVLALAWNPAALFQGRVHIDKIQATGIRVRLGSETGDTTLSPFSLPFPLELQALSADNISIASDQQEGWHIRGATISSLTYRGDALRIQQCTLDSPDLAFEASGHLRTNDGYPLELKVAATFHPEGYAAMKSHATIQGPLNELAVEATIDAPFSARIDGVMNNLMATTTWQARVESPALTLSDIQETWPRHSFSALVAEVRGTLDDYAVQLRTNGAFPGKNEQAEIVAEFQGDGDGLKVHDLLLRHHASELKVQGYLGWNPHLNWQAEVRGSHLDPALLHADWPGDIAVAFSSSGRLTEHGIKSSLNLTTLQGTLRQRPLAGTGELHIDNQQLRIPNLQLHSGASSLQVNGTLAENLDFLVRLTSPDLGEFWPGAHGRVLMHGQVKGSTQQPAIDIKLSGTDLGIDTHTIQKLQMEAKGILSVAGSLTGFIRAEKVQIGTINMATSQLRLTGSTNRHRLEFEGQGSAFATGFSLEGAFDDHVWRSTISRGRISTQRQGEWRQQQATPLTVSADMASISPLCLVNASSTVCAEGSWQKKESSWHLRSTTKSLPLALFHPILPATASFSGLMNAEVDVAGQHNQILSAQLSITNGDMRLSIPLNENRTHQVSWKKNALQARYAKDQLRASLESELTDGSVLRAAMTSSADQLALQQVLHAPFNGSLQLQLHDLSPLMVLTDRAVHPSGTIQGQWSMSGTPLAPVFKGQMELTNGQAEIPPLGITLAPLTLSVTGNAQTLHLLASARSGNGVLTAESALQLDRLTTGPSTIHLTGESFRAAHLPGLDLEITPDILLKFDQQRTEARGSVVVPHARITSIDFDHGLSPSADMVVIDEGEHRDSGSSLPVFAELTIVTGDDVMIDAHGLRGHIDGKLTIHQQPGRPQIGNGTLSIRKGSYTLYGRRLKIDLGRLLFAGGPLTNPGIELRSERKNEKVTTGVVIDGFLQRPEMHFYSTPVMEQSAIVMNLLESTALGGETRQDTGFIGTIATTIGLGGLVPYLQDVKELTMIDEIKFEAGDTYDSYSLVFGSWLTPDFYVSYGKDLVKESGSFNTRYNLGSGFYFLTETGALSSGGDIKYEFEH